MAKKSTRLKTGQRCEFVCLQLDIAWHSELKDAERILHDAKERFHGQIEGIVSSYGGEPLPWEGDRGAFLFHVTDGHEFNESVYSGIRIIESLPSVNHELRDTTRLTQRLSARVSLDKGNAFYHTNPGLITGDFLNAFLKNERAVSLENEVTITDRVHRQLDQALKERFVKFKQSAEVNAELYCTRLTQQQPASPLAAAAPVDPPQAPSSGVATRSSHPPDEKLRAQIRNKLGELSREKMRIDGDEQPTVDLLCKVLDRPLSAGQQRAEDWLAGYLAAYHELALPVLNRIFELSRDQAARSVASRISELIDLVTPMQIPPEVWKSVQEQVAQNPAVLQRAATGLICAEAVAARVGGSPMRVGAGTGPGRKLKLPSFAGQFSAENLPLGPPEGSFAAVVKDLYLGRSLGMGGAAGPDATSPEKMLKDLAKSLRFSKLQHERVPYVVVKLPEGLDNRKHWIDVLAAVKREVNDVMFIELRSDPDAQGWDGFVLTCLNTRFDS
jgi:hypothetical protein